MPDTLSQHVSWDAIKYGLGVIGGFGLLSLTWFGAALTTNRRDISYIKANYPTREEVNRSIKSCQIDLVSRMENSEKNLMKHIDRSGDSVKDILYVMHPECKPDD